MIQARQIEAFQAVMQTGAMTAAAELLHVTQPAVSRIIRELEREIGFPLFSRRGNLILPTAEARLLLGAVERSFQGLRSIGEFAANLRRGHVGLLRLAVLPAMAAGFLPRFAARYAATRPELQIELESMSSPLIREAVASGGFDLGVVSMPFVEHMLVATPFRDAAVVVMPAGHVLAGLREVRAAELRDQDLFLLQKFVDGRHSVQAELASVQTGRIQWVPHSAMAAAMALELGALAIIDPFSAEDFVRQGAAVRPFHPRLFVGTGMVRPRERALSTSAAEFHDAFVAHVEAFLARMD